MKFGGAFQLKKLEFVNKDMKILFLCGSAEPGKDGVGDYTRRLCGELIRRGHQAQMLSLYDKHSDVFVSQLQVIENTEVIVNRIPTIASYSQRLSYTQEIVQKFTPDWISLQFVPYSFNTKGLPFWLPSFLKNIKGEHKWHVMFHELWVGIEDNSSFKNKCFGFLQRQLISNILENFKNITVSTNTYLYQHKISDLGHDSNFLSLFSNISNDKLVEINNSRIFNKELKFALFGGIHHGAPIQQFVDELKLELEKRNIQILKFLIIGNCGIFLKEWTLIFDAEKIEYEISGYCSDQEISEKLLMCDFGLSTTPYLLIQKSGSVAAYLDHELPVICVARKWAVSGFDMSNTNQIGNIFDFQKHEIFEILDSKIEMQTINTLSSVTSSFLKSLNSV